MMNEVRTLSSLSCSLRPLCYCGLFFPPLARKERHSSTPSLPGRGCFFSCVLREKHLQGLVCSHRSLLGDRERHGTFKGSLNTSLDCGIIVKWSSVNWNDVACFKNTAPHEYPGVWVILISNDFLSECILHITPERIFSVQPMQYH